MATLDPEQVDFADLARRLVATLGGSRLEGFVVGRTRLRDAAALLLSCSDLEAEQIVDTMIMRGFLRYAEQRPSGQSGAWVVELAS